MAGPWEREFYQPEHGDAVLDMIVFGELNVEMAISAADYRTSGPPAGTELQLFRRSEHEAWIQGWTDGYLGVVLAEQPELDAAVRAAPTMAMLRGTVPDPSTLDYLRDAVGVVTALTEAGGVAVLDASSLRWWSPDEWRETLFDSNAPEPVEHVSLLASPEPDGLWLHSRGMRKFGRPDLSVRGISEDEIETFAALFESLVTTLAAGAVIPDGQRMRIDGTKIELESMLVGSEEDVEFENGHYELVRVSPAA